jgi:hypothetical protein
VALGDIWAGNPDLYKRMLAWKARKVPVRADWGALKVGVMRDFLTFKYTQNPKRKALSPVALDGNQASEEYFQQYSMFSSFLLGNSARLRYCPLEGASL